MLSYVSYKLIVYKVTYFAVPKPLSFIFQNNFSFLTWETLTFQRLQLCHHINNPFS